MKHISQTIPRFITRPINPSEWIEIGHVAVRTNSVLTAARVGAKVTRTRQAGRTRDGIEWMCLARFRKALQ